MYPKPNPTIHVLGRFFAAYPENGSGFQTFLAYLEVFLAPTAGIGALVVFLTLQTGAKTQLMRMLRLDFTIEAIDTTAKRRHHSKKRGR